MYGRCSLALRIPHLFIRSLHKRSRFQPIDPIDINHLNHINHTKINEKFNVLISNDSNNNNIDNNNNKDLDNNLEISLLQNSIISKLNSLEYSSNDFYDIHLLYEKDKLLLELSEIDKHILLLSKEIAPDSTNISSSSSTTSNYIYSDDLDLQNFQSLKFKYDLINNKNSIIELETLIDFVNRISQNHYLNYNLMIKRFLKKRLVYAKDIHPLLRDNKELIYILMNYFLKNYKYSHLSIAKYIVSINGSWDIYMINILLKNTLNYTYNLSQSLLIIDQTLQKCINDKIQLNSTTLFLIYDKINDLKDIDFTIATDLNNYLHKLFINSNLNNNKHFTNIAYKKLFSNYKKIQNSCTLNTQLKNSLINDSSNSISLIPLLYENNSQFLNGNIFQIKSIEKLYLNTKFKNIYTFNRFIEMLLSSNQWKKAWSSIIPVYNVLDSYSVVDLTSIVKNRSNRVQLLEINPRFNISNFGRLFHYDKHFLSYQIKNYLSVPLLTYLINTNNWQLLIRSINEIRKIGNSINENNSNSKSNSSSNFNGYIIEQVLRKLSKLDLNDSYLDKTHFLILSKYILNLYLSNQYSCLKFSNALINELQHKIDKLYDTKYSYSSNFNNKINKRINSVRTEYLSTNKFNKTSLLSSCFQTSSSSNSHIEDKSNSINAKDISNDDLYSPNILEYTKFELSLYENLDQLYLLDTPEKLKKEKDKYYKQWEDKCIKDKDILKNYHLGFINRDYSRKNIKWVNKTMNDLMKGDEIRIENNEIKNNVNKNGIDDDDKFIDEIKNNKLNKIESQIKDDISKLLNTSSNFKVMEKKYTKSYPDGKFVIINPIESSIHNIQPNDWIDFVINKTLNDKITENLSN